MNTFPLSACKTEQLLKPEKTCKSPKKTKSTLEKPKEQLRMVNSEKMATLGTHEPKENRQFKSNSKLQL